MVLIKRDIRTIYTRKNKTRLTLDHLYEHILPKSSVHANLLLTCKFIIRRLVNINLYLYLHIFICHTITIITKKCQKKCRKKWRGGLKETIELMLIRTPQLQFFEGGIKITATDTKYYQVEN